MCYNNTSDRNRSSNNNDDNDDDDDDDDNNNNDDNNNDNKSSTKTTQPTSTHEGADVRKLGAMDRPPRVHVSDSFYSGCLRRNQLPCLRHRRTIPPDFRAIAVRILLETAAPLQRQNRWNTQA